ncbi:MAG: DinB family protein [Pirellulaceae bacterium]|nr:DinB family protein [Pirellulaceae bacterium]
MHETITQIEDLYRYNDWANSRVFEMCQGLSHAQQDQKRELGFGTLRNTLFHILTAEQIWLERWQVVPWRPFPTDALGMSVDYIEAQLKQISQARLQMIKAEKATRWQRVVNYKDSRGNAYSNPLDVLLLHVANHSTYHRAQALAYLKQFDRTVPVGIDYLLYKLARPTLEQPTESVTKLNEMGLRVATASGWNVRWDGQLMSRYVEYGHWANSQILDLLGDADAATLDRDFGLGHGSIRRTLTHLVDVESRWAAIFENRLEQWKPAGMMDLQQLRSRLDELTVARREQVAGLDDAAAQTILTTQFGEVELKVRVVEVLVQLCTHGTHHRAQLVNMLRQVGRQVPESDLIAWWRRQP